MTPDRENRAMPSARAAASLREVEPPKGVSSKADIPIAEERDAFEWERITDQIIEQANATPWVWREHRLSILGPSSGLPRQWILWHKKHTHYTATMADAKALLESLGFIDLRREFIGEEFIPEYWRPSDGAWADTCDGLDGPQITALTRDGDEIDLARRIEARQGGDAAGGAVHESLTAEPARPEPTAVEG